LTIGSIVLVLALSITLSKATNRDYYYQKQCGLLKIESLIKEKTPANLPILIFRDPLPCPFLSA